ncbi:MAG: hypothetical protein M3Q81_02190 [bacterium]|nr:hypothetical protein [bacterium]
MSKQLLAQAVPPAVDNSVFGTVTPPKGVAAYGATNASGLVPFISNLIRIGTVVAGVWVLFNFILAGYEYITAAGDTKVNTSAKERLTMSIVGLVIIVAAYTIIAVISLLIFGEADYILNPTICGPAGCN